MNLSSAQRRRTAAFRRLYPLLILLVLTGCGSMQGSGGWTGTGLRGEPPPAPRWDEGAASDTGETADLREPGAFTYSGETDVLRGQLLARCGTARITGEQGLLPPLVHELYLSGIEPDVAADALILGDCGSMTEVVSELVAQGGSAVAVVVAERARVLAGPGTESMIESAVAEGLRRHARGRSIALDSPAAERYAMAYFPSRAVAPEVETADTATALYAGAKPGYGLYTFVLTGIGTEKQANLSELLRVIETYVLASGGSDRASSETHSFLVAVDPGRSGQALELQAAAAGPALSALMRRDLGLYLTHIGEDALARRLMERPGPFLVSSPQASLLPVDEPSPRLVVDLSDVGGEYMYAVVDAFDRPVSSGRGGGSLALDAVRSRLLASVAVAGEGAGAKRAWVFRVEAPRRRDASPGGGDEGGNGQAAPERIIEYQRPRIREAALGRSKPEQA